MDEVPTSTRVGIQRREGLVAVWSRRAVLALIALFLLLGLTGYLGVRSSTASADEDGYHVSVRYAAIARSGLDVPFAITVTADGGFGKQLTLAITGDYFDIFETQGFLPDPATAVRDGDVLYLTFDTPEGHTFEVTYDAYIQPASQQGRAGSVSVVTNDGSTVATVPFRTRLLP